jgi:hypothetical protein
MAQPVLLQSGLTMKEAELYEALLALGEVPIVDLMKKTGDHPQVVYLTLIHI